MAQGRFITFEGGEGSGKSTQARLLAERLQASGRDCLVTREPGGSPYADQLRDLILSPAVAAHGPLSEALTFYAARADHLEKTIRPALGRGQWVICDRFSDSTRAYQGAAGGLADAIIATLERIVVGATAPDLTVLLDIDAKAGLARAESRRKGGIVGASPGAFVAVDTFEARTLAFHERLRDGFLGIAKHEPARVVVLDAFQNAQTLSDQVLALVTTRLGSPS